MKYILLFQGLITEEDEAEAAAAAEEEAALDSKPDSGGARAVTVPVQAEDDVERVAKPVWEWRNLSSGGGTPLGASGTAGENAQRCVCDHVFLFERLACFALV